MYKFNSNLTLLAKNDDGAWVSTSFKVGDRIEADRLLPNDVTYFTSTFNGTVNPPLEKLQDSKETKETKK